MPSNFAKTVSLVLVPQRCSLFHYLNTQAAPGDRLFPGLDVRSTYECQMERPVTEKGRIQRTICGLVVGVLH